MKKTKKVEEKITQKILMTKNLRKCSHTGKILPLSEFKLMKNGKYDSLSNQGRKLYQQKYREKNPEKKKELDKNYRERMRAKKANENLQEN